MLNLLLALHPLEVVVAKLGTCGPSPLDCLAAAFFRFLLFLSISIEIAEKCSIADTDVPAQGLVSSWHGLRQDVASAKSRFGCPISSSAR